MEQHATRPCYSACSFAPFSSSSETGTNRAVASPLHLIAQPTPLAACTVQDSLGWSEALTLTTQSFETLVVSGERIGRMDEESLKILLAHFPESAAAVGCLMAFISAGCHSTAALVRVVCTQRRRVAPVDLAPLRSLGNSNCLFNSV